jgi:hypothetical protein
MLQAFVRVFTGDDSNLILDAGKIVVGNFEARHDTYNTKITVSNACLVRPCR